MKSLVLEDHDDDDGADRHLDDLDDEMRQKGRRGGGTEQG